MVNSRATIYESRGGKTPHIPSISESCGGKTPHIPCSSVYSCSVVNSHATMVSESRGGKTPHIPSISERRGGKTPHNSCCFRSTELIGFAVPKKPTTNGYRVRRSFNETVALYGREGDKHFLLFLFLFSNLLLLKQWSVKHEQRTVYKHFLIDGFAVYLLPRFLQNKMKLKGLRFQRPLFIYNHIKVAPFISEPLCMSDIIN